MNSIIEEFERNTPAECAHKGCKAKPRWRVGWKAYALGHPKVDRNSISAFLDRYVVCDEHRAGIDVKDLLLPAGRERINGTLMQMGRALLDFTTAEIAFKRIGEGF